MQLRRQLWLWTAAAGLLWAATGWGLRALGYAAWPGWLATAGAALILHLGWLWASAGDNRPIDGGALYPTLGPANQITVARGVLNSLVAGLIVAPPTSGGLAWAAALGYTVGALADIADGFVARRSGRLTLLGRRLDMEYDALGVLLINLLVVRAGKLPWWFLAVGLARYAFVLGLAWRRRRGRPTAELTPSVQRRVAAGMMMGLLSVLIWPLVAPPETVVAGYGFGLPFGVIFLRDWLVVSTRLDPAHPTYRALRSAVVELARRWLPLAARAGAVALWAIGGGATVGGATVGGATVGGATIGGAGWLTALGWAGAAALGAGVLGRLAALVVIAAAVLSGRAAGDTPARLALLLCGVIAAQFGSGRWALWSPEERWFGDPT